MRRYKSLDEFFLETEQFREEVNQLRAIVLKTDVKEEFKWNLPIYTVKGKNIIGIGSFKAYAGLWFHQGALLSDPYHVLINASEGKTVAQRQWRFKSMDEIDEEKILIYVHEAILNQEMGKEIKAQKKALVIPNILSLEFEKNPLLASKFEDFSHGKKREFADYISSAKQEKTKRSRLEKIKPYVMDGIGLNDKYRNC